MRPAFVLAASLPPFTEGLSFFSPPLLLAKEKLQ
jgi:hypothetical protein